MWAKTTYTTVTNNSLHVYDSDIICTFRAYAQHCDVSLIYFKMCMQACLVSYWAIYNQQICGTIDNSVPMLNLQHVCTMVG